MSTKPTEMKPLTLTIDWVKKAISPTRARRFKDSTYYAIHRTRDTFKKVKSIEAAHKILRNRNIENIDRAVYINSLGKHVNISKNQLLTNK